MTNQTLIKANNLTVEIQRLLYSLDKINSTLKDLIEDHGYDPAIKSFFNTALSDIINVINGKVKNLRSEFEAL